jgi:hypothetical protein
MMLKKKNFWTRLKTIFIPRIPRTTRKNRTSPQNGRIKIFLFENINILTELTNFKSKPKKSQSCVPLMLLLFSTVFHCTAESSNCAKKCITVSFL